jgi:hypothetical protein
VALGGALLSGTFAMPAVTLETKKVFSKRFIAMLLYKTDAIPDRASDTQNTVNKESSNGVSDTGTQNNHDAGRNTVNRKRLK